MTGTTKQEELKNYTKHTAEYPMHNKTRWNISITTAGYYDRYKEKQQELPNGEIHS